MELPSHFTIERRVVSTFIRNDFSRKECAAIMLCSVHTIDTQMEKFRKDKKAANDEKVVCDCFEMKWIRNFTEEEIQHYKKIAEYNMYKGVRRKAGEPIQWQKIHDELYPS